MRELKQHCGEYRGAHAQAQRALQPGTAARQCRRSTSSYFLNPQAYTVSGVSAILMKKSDYCLKRSFANLLIQ